MSIDTEKSILEKEFEENENKKLWKIIMMSLKQDSDKLMEAETFNFARDTQNRSRNRYRDVLPFDSTRVKLPEIGSSDYINASFVNLTDNRFGRRYILTQGPLTTTISHFWRMIWNENTTCIIMLNKILEKDTIKCAQYFPTSEKENDNHFYSDIDLSLSFVESFDHKSYMKRIFVLQNNSTDEKRRITQFHYQSWPDFGVPNSCELFLQFLWDIRANGGLDDPQKPAVVHCSAGIGRSGTFILIDLALLQIAEQQSCKSVDLKQMLLELRKCRIGLIQTAEQLRFAYASVISGAKIILNEESTDSAKQPIDYSTGIYEHEPTDSSVSSDEEIDSDFSENSDSNSALDKAAAAVRTRRGLPPTNSSESSLIISQNNYNNHEVDISKTEILPSEQMCTIDKDRKTIRELRCNRTRKILEDIRNNMRRQDLERERIIFRLGLHSLANTLTRQNRTSIIAGASAIVGILSLACGYFVYKFI